VVGSISDWLVTRSESLRDSAQAVSYEIRCQPATLWSVCFATLILRHADTLKTSLKQTG